MLSKHTDEECHDEIANKTDKNVVVVLNFGFADGLDFLEVNVLVFVHEISGVLDRVELVGVANYEEGPDYGDNEGNETQSQI